MKITILEYNHCNLTGCSCGWNITFSGNNSKTLKKLKKIIKENFEIKDIVDYKHKMSTEKFSKDNL